MTAMAYLHGKYQPPRVVLAGGESLAPGAAVHSLDLLHGHGRSGLRPHAATAAVLIVLAISRPGYVLIWERGWGLSGKKRTGSGMKTGLLADGGDRNGNAGLQNEILELEAQGQLLLSSR